jgi:hypothetical protein
MFEVGHVTVCRSWVWRHQLRELFMPIVIDQDRPDLGGNLRHGDINTFCPIFWKFLIERYAVGSILDVGCGEGHGVAYFRRLGVVAHGIDGLLTNVQRAVTPISLHDLCTAAFVMPVDLVWSCEVAEHISEYFSNLYIETLTNGRIIALTAALPGQAGYSHVNCQPPEYWIERISAFGYHLSPEMDALRSASHAEGRFTYFQQSGLVFERN